MRNKRKRDLGATVPDWTTDDERKAIIEIDTFACGAESLRMNQIWGEGENDWNPNTESQITSSIGAYKCPKTGEIMLLTYIGFGVDDFLVTNEVGADRMSTKAASYTLRSWATRLERLAAAMRKVADRLDGLLTFIAKQV